MSQDAREGGAGRPPAQERDAPPGREAGAWIDSAALMRGRREVMIVHAGERYRLRVTASDKLILTK
ncbi:hypothetical protein OPKNFCMD_1907 [Methylobacterium crusticola]|uniref:Hemin uptake protein HemP n=1 Tax=Methylobacterium crusticola TaxID=1697972 RepID=A0ABQ4QX68_9HYPH|nr:hemin uptake protein HemP [Methylobacterium crusticola]GJD49177.1 hypothetical protein OPKNFCMD_1907 [Methylobacterium crusticola]